MVQNFVELKSGEKEHNPLDMKRHAHRTQVQKPILKLILRGASAEAEFRQKGLQGASSSKTPLELQVKNLKENTYRGRNTEGLDYTFQKLKQLLTASLLQFKLAFFEFSVADSGEMVQAVAGSGRTLFHFSVPLSVLRVPRVLREWGRRLGFVGEKFGNTKKRGMKDEGRGRGAAGNRNGKENQGEGGNEELEDRICFFLPFNNLLTIIFPAFASNIWLDLAFGDVRPAIFRSSRRRLVVEDDGSPMQEVTSTGTPSLHSSRVSISEAVPSEGREVSSSAAMEINDVKLDFEWEEKSLAKAATRKPIDFVPCAVDFAFYVPEEDDLRDKNEKGA
ncbi:uncharacterized protein G2W53_009477 [Senna tora]|uniref:Uncharacterized protein n=1 Tax=Senna tora TaxID=362788 RepID=A0A834WYG7_9FABA|nr:uncharacterized protein G2W53_009477 [Senna tora]